MNILHTADWHIGKSLHKHSLDAEMQLYFDFLIETIVEKSVDVLLVSGDIFDSAHPAAKDRKTYYQLLSRLMPLDVKVIITGGNHDSVAVLDAPKELLEELDISIVAGAKSDLAEELIPIYEDDKLALVVAAVPFLRDRDLRVLQADANYETRAEALRAGIARHYAELTSLAQDRYSEVPLIAMGHLYATGAMTSESERDIHVGNAAAVDASTFAAGYDYVALGHIHRPQRVDQHDFIRYSGSPIALSFSEKKDEKSMLLISVQDGKVQMPEILPIPKKRALVKFAGRLDAVRDAIAQYENELELPTFCEIEVSEESYSAGVLLEVDQLVAATNEKERIKILRTRVHFEQGAQDTSHLFEVGQQIDDMSAAEIFDARLSQEEMSDDRKEKLKLMFSELVDSVAQMA